MAICVIVSHLSSFRYPQFLLLFFAVEYIAPGGVGGGKAEKEKKTRTFYDSRLQAIWLGEKLFSGIPYRKKVGVAKLPHSPHSLSLRPYIRQSKNVYSGREN